MKNLTGLILIVAAGAAGCHAVGQPQSSPTPTQRWTAKVSAYSSRARETDSRPCQAADTSNICNRYERGEKICATADRNVPFGTKIEVPGYGTCTVADRMNKRYVGTGRVDIYFGRDTRTALVWGVKKLQVTRLN